MNARQTKLTNKLLTFWDSIADTQEWWLANHGEYCQLIHPSEIIPNGDDEVDLDTERGNPSDRPWVTKHFWRRAKHGIKDGTEDETEIKYELPISVLAGISKVRSALAFDVSEGPSGRSWRLRMSYKQGSTVWQYTRGKDDTEGVWAEVIDEI